MSQKGVSGPTDIRSSRRKPGPTGGEAPKVVLNTKITKTAKNTKARSARS